MKTETIDKKPIDIESIIKKNNKIWEKSTKMQKRVLIAKDVIKQVKSGLYNASTGSWLNVYNYTKKEVSLQKELINAEQNKTSENIECSCCALGSMMLSCIKYKNNINVLNQYSRIDFYEKKEIEIHGEDLGDIASNQIHEVFDESTLQKIESWFEKNGGKYNIDYIYDLPDDISDELIYYIENDELLIMLMQNIVEGRGRFSNERMKKSLADRIKSKSKK